MKECFKSIVKYSKLMQNALIEALSWRKNLILPIGEKVYIIGTPEHKNMGDSAIVIAEKLFLEKCGYKSNHIKEFLVNEFKNDMCYFKRYIPKHYLICGHGGGNLGNLWYCEEEFRYSFMDAFPDNPIIIFPQTVFFTDDEEGEKAQKTSLSHYENHKNLTIVAREKQSFQTLKTLYHNPTVLLTPDIVLSTCMEDYGVSVKRRSGVLLVFRNDLEKAVTDDVITGIEEYLADQYISFRKTDMCSQIPVTKQNRLHLVSQKMQEFADSELVITDRLHGMVFAAITGTPCIVFSNNHHKVSGTYEWISHLPYIQFVSSKQQAISMIPDLLKLPDFRYDNTAIIKLFEPLEKEIKQYAD